MKMPHFPVPSWKNDNKYDLKNISILLKALNNPHLRLPPTIHIAGTNGKGSSAAMLKSIFMASGYNVHSYTSPHLLEFNERIVLNGEKISDNELWEVCEHVRIASQKTNVEPGLFEGTTAAAFLAFAHHKADILILETGLGGRLDATNIIDKPLITLITPISYDHMNRLGYTLPLIANEKAGIIKQGVPCVISAQVPEVYEVLLNQAVKKKSPSFCFEYDFGIQKTNKGFIYLSKDFSYEFSAPSLPGNHQLVNAVAVIATISLINEQYNINNKAIEKGLSSTVWPARIQKIDPQKYATFAGHNIQIWVDGAHNNAGAQVLANWAQDNLEFPIYMIIGMTKNRDIREFCEYFRDLTIKGYGVKVMSEALSYSAEEVAQAGATAGIQFVSANSLDEAIKQIAILSNGSKVNIIITGSLFLAADFFKIINY